MAIDVGQLVAALELQYGVVTAHIAGLPPADVSSAGRSISATSARAGLLAQLKDIETRLAQLGSPVGGIGAPFVLRSRVAP